MSPLSGLGGSSLGPTGPGFRREEPQPGGLAMRVMIVDDSSPVRQHLKAVLSALPEVEGVWGVRSGEEALDQMDEVNPALVILDLMLPGANGIEVLEKVKQRESAPVVAVYTNYPYPAFRRRCEELGADYFLSKSVDPEEIREVVRTVGR